jgi:intein-encoded DNA endonuclease-like protein
MKTREELLELAKIHGWEYISYYQKLPEDFIHEFQDRVDWHWISARQKLSEDFIRKFQDRVDWFWISTRQEFSEDFYFDFADRIEFRLIDKRINKWANKNMSDELKLFLKLRGEL